MLGRQLSRIVLFRCGTEGFDRRVRLLVHGIDAAPNIIDGISPSETQQSPPRLDVDVDRIADPGFARAIGKIEVREGCLDVSFGLPDRVLHCHHVLTRIQSRSAEIFEGPPSRIGLNCGGDLSGIVQARVVQPVPAGNRIFSQSFRQPSLGIDRHFSAHQFRNNSSGFTVEYLRRPSQADILRDGGVALPPAHGLHDLKLDLVATGDDFLYVKGTRSHHERVQALGDGAVLRLLVIPPDSHFPENQICSSVLPATHQWIESPPGLLPNFLFQEEDSKLRQCPGEDLPLRISGLCLADLLDKLLLELQSEIFGVVPFNEITRGKVISPGSLRVRSSCIQNFHDESPPVALFSLSELRVVPAELELITVVVPESVQTF